MLRTTVGRLRAAFPNCKIGVSLYNGSRNEIAMIGCSPLYISRPHVGHKKFSSRFFLERALNGLHLEHCVNSRSSSVSSGRISHFIDISGFAYTDQWGISPIRDLFKLLKYHHERGVKTIMLPQAFGPFESEESQFLMSRCLEYADVVFPRDASSLGFLQRLKPACHFSVCPDITIGSDRGSAEKIETAEPAKIAIVPNCRLLDQGADDWGRRYTEVLSLMIEYFRNNGSNVVIFCHDSSGGDYGIARSLCDRFELGVPEEVRCPFKFKDSLREFSLLIGSRFHSLVSGLSVGTAVVALGWSHKYEELLYDYGLREHIVESKTTDREIFRLLANCCDPEYLRSIRAQIEGRNGEVRIMIDLMWKQVLAGIR